MAFFVRTELMKTKARMTDKVFLKSSVWNTQMFEWQNILNRDYNPSQCIILRLNQTKYELVYLG